LGIVFGLSLNLNMLSAFQTFVKEHALFLPEDRILLAISGGLDSVVMAHLFHQSGFCFALAHCNFSLRDTESDADEMLVRDLAKAFGVEFYSEQFDTVQYASIHKYGIQEAARTLRYNWFNELCVKHKFAYISTAHHSDDSIETFFVNLTRGAGITGLKGIPMKNGWVIRPLLFASKTALHSYAQENSIAFREDSSNAGDKYLRNRIRHSVLPMMEELNPSFRKTLLREMQHISDAGLVLDKIMEEQKNSCLHKDQSGIYFLLKDLEGKEPLRFYLFEWLKGFGFRESVVLNLADLLKRPGYAGKLFYSKTYELLVERDRISIRAKQKTIENSDRELLLVKETAAYESPIALQTECVDGADRNIGDDPREVYLDAGKLKFPLLLRKWKEGDRFQPLGMKGSKLLSDYFSDNKFSKSSKEDTWVLESLGSIVWLVGHRMDERYKVEQDTKEIFIIRAD
jgi:tRNA(Ile)-lysidine synthase